jgi:hypothetical protein
MNFINQHSIAVESEEEAPPLTETQQEEYDKMHSKARKYLSQMR